MVRLGFPSATDRHLRQFADAAQRPDQLRRLDREEDRLRIWRTGELGDRLDIFLGDEIVDRLGAAGLDRVAHRLGRCRFGLSSPFARLGFPEGGFAARPQPTGSPTASRPRP